MKITFRKVQVLRFGVVGCVIVTTVVFLIPGLMQRSNEPEGLSVSPELNSFVPHVQTRSYGSRTFRGHVLSQHGGIYEIVHVKEKKTELARTFIPLRNFNLNIPNGPIILLVFNYLGLLERNNKNIFVL